MGFSNREWQDIDHRIRGILENALDKESDVIALGYKGYGITARGQLAILAMVILLVGGTACYLLWAMKVEAALDHSEIVIGQDLLGCIVSMDSEARKRVRSFNDRESFLGECPWLRLYHPTKGQKK